jgi:hypothetical protein
MSATPLINGTKDVVTIIKDLVLLILILLLFLCPEVIQDILARSGVKKANIMGMELETGFAKSDLQLKEAQMTITNLSGRLDSTNMLLTATQQGGAGDPKLRQEIAKAQTMNEQEVRATETVQKSIEQTISTNAPLATKVQKAVNSDEQWGVVWSGDADLQGATYEVTTIAQKFELPNARVYFRQGSYRSVSIVDSRQEAKEVLNRAKKRRGDAYIVPMNVWCSSSEEGDGFVRCK